MAKIPTPKPHIRYILDANMRWIVCYNWWLSLEKCWSHHLSRLKFVYPRMHFDKFGWNLPSGSGEEDFYILSMYFRYFVIISELKRAGALYKNNLESLNSSIHCANVGGNWSSGSWEEDEHVKSLRQRKRQRWQQRQRQRRPGRTTDKFWSEKLTWALMCKNL